MAAYKSELVRSLILAVDATGYGSRDDHAQQSLQEGLHRILNEAAHEAHLDRSLWRKQPSGDGEMAVLPADAKEARVVDNFVHELEIVLNRYNREHAEAFWLRLRVAIHNGVAMNADNGYAGQGVVAASRMLDSDAFKKAMADAKAVLGLILSDTVYQTTVAQHYTGFSPNDFRRINVRNKEYKAVAWMLLVRSPGDEVGVRTSRPSGRRRTVIVSVAVALVIVASVIAIALGRNGNSVGSRLSDSSVPAPVDSSVAGHASVAVPLIQLLEPSPVRKSVYVAGQQAINVPAYSLRPKGCAMSAVDATALLDGKFGQIRLVMALADDTDDSVRTNVVVRADAREVEEFILSRTESRSVELPMEGVNRLSFGLATFGQGDCSALPYDVVLDEAFAFPG